MELIRFEQRVPPVRGLALACNRRGRAYSDLALKRWIRLNREVFKTTKVDVFA